MRRDLARVADDPAARAGGIRPGRHDLRPGAAAGLAGEDAAGRWSCSTKPRRSRTPARPRRGRVKKLPAAGRIVLTGTPVENHLGDLWSLFDFCCPGLLGTAAQFKQFVKRLNQQQDAQAFGALRRLVRPYILRRLKTDPAIVPDLPEKTEMRAECGLSKKQAALYEQAVDDLAAAAGAGRGHGPPRPGAGDADAAQADLQPSGAVPRAARRSRPTRAASSSGCGCSASRSPSGRRRCSSSRSFSR